MSAVIRFRAVTVTDEPDDAGPWVIDGSDAIDDKWPAVVEYAQEDAEWPLGVARVTVSQ